MQKFIKKTAFLLFFLIFSGIILCNPEKSLFYALNGLNTWFEHMIPTLFPFMVLTGIMIRMELAGDFAKLFRPILFPLLRLRCHCLYVVLMGFVCGFPMGAKITGDMYRLRQLSKKEASYLLSFCNNIGPVFFTGFVLPFLPGSHCVFSYLLGMYGIPLGYGILLRFFFFSKNGPPDPVSDSPLSGAFACGRNSAAIQKPPSFAKALDASVSSAIQSITKLGGYMIFFNLWNLLPQLVIPEHLILPRAVSSLFLEITGGIVLAGSSHPVLILSLLQFGGISCLMQTYSMISDTDLSLPSYIFHKSIQTLLAFAYYTVLLH